MTTQFKRIDWKEAKGLIQSNSLKMTGGHSINNQGTYTISQDEKRLYKRRYQPYWRPLWDLIALAEGEPKNLVAED